MIATFDVETRGMFGEIFRIGYYDAVNGYKNFYTGKEFLDYVTKVSESLPLVEKVGRTGKISQIPDMLDIYAFNLEFDARKLLSESIEKKFYLGIDLDKSLIINNRAHFLKLEQKNIYLRDIYPIVNSSLEQAAESFELPTKKQMIAGDKEEYFKSIDADETEFLEYLKSDVLATYELVMKLIQLSGLSESNFVRCPTVASLAMKVFKTRMSGDFEIIKKSVLYKTQEDFVRESYYGGRTEIFKPLAKTGYHYDVNSLYPFEMQENFYPVGDAISTLPIGEVIRNKNKDIMTHERLANFKKLIDEQKYLYIIDCVVEVPEVNIPILPYRQDGKLLFPVGSFRGCWTSIELDYAVSKGVEVKEIYKIIVWKKKEKVFKNFVDEFREMKENSFGAKKFFAKLIQNSLYGKFGMRRHVLAYEKYTDEKRNKLDEKNILNARIRSLIGTDIIKYKKFVHADYIRPQFSAFITSYARISLVKQMHRLEERGAEIYYCDTDSIVTNLEIEPEFCHEKKYGLWALERTITEGIFILPKLYAELEINGKEILKSKGLIKSYIESVKYEDYKKIYKSMVRRENYIAYDNETKQKYYGFRKIITAITSCKKLDEKILLKKRYLFANENIHKRVFDFDKNSSKPIWIGGNYDESI